MSYTLNNMNLATLDTLLQARALIRSPLVSTAF